MILDQAFKYITELKRQNDEFLLNGGNNEQAEEIKKLRKQLEEIQKENGRYIELLKANDICLYDDPTIHWKGNLKNSKVSVVIPSDQIQKNIIVYSNGSQPGGNNQGAAVQGITFNVGHNLQKQTANVVPVQRTCNLVTPVSISGVYPSENKPWHQTTVSALAANQPVPLCLPATIPAQNILKLATSKSDSHVLGATRGSLVAVPVGPEPCQHRSLHTSLNDQNSSENKNGKENPKLLKKIVPCATSVPSSSSATTTKVNPGGKFCPSTQDLRSDFQTTFVVSVTTTVCSQPPTSAGDSGPVSISKGADSTSVTAVVAPSVPEGGKTTAPVSSPSANPLDNGWTLSCSLPSSAVSASDLKNINSLTRISSSGNTQTTWTTLQLAGNTIQPLSQTPSSAVTPVLNESGTSPTTIKHSRHMATGINSNNSLPADGQPVEQVVVTLPSCPPLPMQPVIAQSQVKSQTPPSILPLNSAMQVIQMAQPVGTAVKAAPANQNVIILQPPSTTPCPTVMRAEVPNPTVGQQIVIIQAANQNPLPLLSAQPPGSVRLPVNGANAIIGSNSVQNVSTPQTFGGKHLVHILPRPSSLSTSNSTQTFSVTVSNQQQPQTISLNGQLFALQPVMSSSGTTNQNPMQIIQPTTSEDPNTNVALNTFGALASLNQSISQMAGQSCVQLSVGQPANPQTIANNQTTPANSASLTATVVSPMTTDTSATLPSTYSLVTTPSVNTVACLPNVKSKRLNKKPGVKKHLAANKSACPLNPVSDVGQVDCPSTEGSAEPPCNDGLLESPPLVVPSVTVSQTKSTVNVSGSHSLDVPNSESVIPESVPKSKSAEGSNSPCQESITSEHFAVASAKSKDSVPVVQETSQDKPPISLALSDAPKFGTSANVFIPSPNDPPVLVSQVSVSSSTTSITSTDCITEVEIIAEPCGVEQDSSDRMQTTGLLKEQGLTALLSGLAKDKDPQKSSLSVQVDHPDFSSESSKIIDSNIDLHPKQELLLMNSDDRDPGQHHSCIPDQEIIHGSLLTSRQADSPMSTSSGSSRSFSVASMLPETTREDVTSNVTTNTCDSCTFVEQTDIVALAARAIFDQENLEKGKAGTQADTREVTSKPSEASSLEGDQPFKTQVSKENSLGQAEATSNEFNSQDSIEATVDRPHEKPSCSVGIKTSNASLQVSNSQPPSITSLSVNNLIHQSSISHSLVSCAGLSQTSESTTVSATVNLTVSSSSYGSQPPGPSLMTEYSQEQLSTMTGTVPTSQIQEPLLKPSHESRKDSAKRAVQDDLLLSSAKRQKHCQPAPLRLEGMSLVSRTPDSISDHTQMMVSQIPPNSSNSVVPISNPAHGDGLTRLFPPSNNFVAPALRQTEVQCSSQPSVAEQQQTQASQHLQVLQQHVPAQGVSHLHSNHLYLKQQQQQQQQQQQAGQLRERHHLYQLQHHIPHAESSVHSQPHNVHQQRTLQQEVHMHKKRNLVQGTQASQLSLQPKHHGTDQSRSKSGQPHPHHQQIQQQMQQHFGSSQSEKSCENPSTSRNHPNHPQNHLNQDIMHQQQEVGGRQQGSGVSSEHVTGHNPMQRLLTSRGIEQQMVSQPSIVTRPSDMTCTPHRPERNRVSSYSAEALIGKTSSNSEQRMGISIQGSRVSDQLEMRSYLDVPRNKNLGLHNMQGRVDHTVAPDIRLSDCQTFKPTGAIQQPQSNFEVQSSRNNEIGNSVSSLRSMQPQAFRISQNPGPPPIDRQKRLPYPPVHSIPAGNAIPPRDSENTCHQSFMQSLLAPHLGDQIIGSQRSLSEHQRNAQCGPSPAVEYNCPPTHESVHIRRESENQNRESCDMPLGAINTRNSTLNIPFSSSSSGDIQGRNTSPNVSVQKSNPMRITDSHGTKGHMNPPVTTNMHGVARPALPHPSVSHGNSDQGPPVRQTNSSVPQRSRHPLQDSSGSKIRQPERNRSGNQRHSNVFDPSLPHLPLSASGSMILGRQQPTTEKRGSIVRFMPDSPQVPNDNSAPDQHTLSQNFGFPFIPEGGMNPPINANTSFIPQVTQPSATRTPALIPVDPQNTLPSFYPSYSPAHPTLSNDIPLTYFSNQMFSNPSTEKVNSGSLNNRFGSILSPPRPVGFAQPSFPLLPDMPPMHMPNSHLSNFNMTSLFPEIATALPDGSAMSPLLTIANSSASDTSKQSSNRPAHNISHILGHDCSSAV
ncbi:basic helix-loop-helix domain-containing protein USF3 isoform X3 [Pipistrellus kuhlii]|uniref:basic helix-loop-helix domain-containing protein USF3 isoform X3 n=1 Tax=Pipistrellus kuhlii TaxID=59472 RepID=UPI001E270513|nr:basic helix-loop-helix domain-containing protein USF3 isoform X3 [Pipistrellus kuhlii]